MPSWGQMLVELAQISKQMQPGSAISPHDVLRRKYTAELSKHTSRATIVYGSAWLETKANDIPGSSTLVTLSDVHGFMETCHQVHEKKLDLIISSPGGVADAAESIMDYLRTQFDHIRVIVPMAAMSAATMMALAADEIVMGTHSQLGPIDPQFSLQTPEGPRQAPGQAIIDQFELAKRECADPANIAAWLPLLRGLAPGLIAQAEAARKGAEEFATRALTRYMFAGDDDALLKATAAAAWFSDFNEFKSHGRRVSREDARRQNLIVTDLEDDKTLQDLVLSVYHAMRITLSQTAVVKIIENHVGRAYMDQVITAVVQGQPPTAPAGPGALPAPTTPPAPGASFRQNRKDRRAGR